MSSAESYIDAQEKLMTLNLLQMALKNVNDTLESFKKYLSARGVDVSIANLSRYKAGKAIPKSKLKDQLLGILVENEELGTNIKQLIHNHLNTWIDNQGSVGVNNTYLLNDSKTLKAILFLAIYQGIIPREVDKIITVEVDGIPVAMTLAHLLNIDCVYARKKKPMGTLNFKGEDILTSSSGRIETIYFPDKFIKLGERVIIVDDVIRSGATQTALVNLVRNSGGIPSKIVVLTGIGKHWEKITELNSIPFKALTTL